MPSFTNEGWAALPPGTSPMASNNNPVVPARPQACGLAGEPPQTHPVPSAAAQDHAATSH